MLALLYAACGSEPIALEERHAPPCSSQHALLHESRRVLAGRKYVLGTDVSHAPR